jgi:drug/metabolite transporter (DMT)-like permease
MMTNSNRTAWIAWATVCIVWGTTYVAIKIALETIPPFLIGGIRYVIAGGVLLAWLAATGRPIPVRATWPRLAVLGFLMLTVGNGGVTWGEQYLASGLTAVIIATTPFWMVGVDAVLPGGSRMSWRHWAGLGVGFVGIVLLVWPDLAVSAGASTIAGVIALQVACLGWAVASGFTRRQGVSSSVLGTAAVQMLFGGVFLTLVGTFTGEWARLAFSARSLSALLYLIVAGSLVAFAAYSHALRNLPVAVVSLHTYVNPVIAVLLGTVLLGEPFRPSMLVAGAVIVAGIAIVQAPRHLLRRRPRVRPAVQNGRA